MFIPDTDDSIRNFDDSVSVQIFPIIKLLKLWKDLVGVVVNSNSGSSTIKFIILLFNKINILIMLTIPDTDDLTFNIDDSVSVQIFLGNKRLKS